MTDLEQFTAMLERAGIPFTSQGIEWNAAHPVPGGTDITMLDTMENLTLVFSFNTDGEIQELAGYK